MSPKERVVFGVLVVSEIAEYITVALQNTYVDLEKYVNTCQPGFTQAFDTFRKQQICCPTISEELRLGTKEH